MFANLSEYSLEPAEAARHGSRPPAPRAVSQGLRIAAAPEDHDGLKPHGGMRVLVRVVELLLCAWKTKRPRSSAVACDAPCHFAPSCPDRWASRGATQPQHRFGGMKTFRILYFRESVFRRSEELRVSDVLEAVDKVSKKPPHLRAEVWSGNVRVAELGPG